MKINYEELYKQVQKECRNLEASFRQIDNREMELAIINLQQSAHWAYHAIGHAQALDEMRKTKDV